MQKELFAQEFVAQSRYRNIQDNDCEADGQCKQPVENQGYS